MAHFKCKQPVIVGSGKVGYNGAQGGEKWCDNRLVEYPVSCTYNGGISIGDEWYEGYEVPSPVVPDGYELVDIAVGLQLNACPPMATMYLKPIEK